MWVPWLQHHLLKVNDTVRQALSAQLVYEYLEDGFHPWEKARMKAQMPKLSCLSLVLRKVSVMLSDLLCQFGMTRAL